MQALKQALFDLDVALTGKAEMARSQRFHKLMSPAAFERFLLGELYYLSDGGYSRVFLKMVNVGALEFELRISSESRREVKDLWARELRLRKAVEEHAHRVAIGLFGVSNPPIDAGIRVHASGKPLVMPVKWDEVPVQEVHMKPKGFWYACGTGWIDWVNENMPSWKPQLAHLYRVILSLKAKILYVRSAADFDALERKYGVPRKFCGLDAIDWIRVARDYDGIEICPYRYDKRLERMWYNPWDVASGCIWNTEIIADLVPIEEKS